MTSIQGQVPNKSKSEKLIIPYRSWGVPVHTGNPRNMATCHCHRDPLATCPNSLQPFPEMNPVTSLYRVSLVCCTNTCESNSYRDSAFKINAKQKPDFYFHGINPLSVMSNCYFDFNIPPYGFVLFSLLVVFLLQECPISFIPGVVQVLSY